jgi:hypothetical protein
MAGVFKGIDSGSEKNLPLDMLVEKYLEFGEFTSCFGEFMSWSVCYEGESILRFGLGHSICLV